MNELEESRNCYQQSGRDFAYYYTTKYLEAHNKNYVELDIELNNVLEALQVAFALGMQTELVQGIHLFYPFLESRGQYTEAQEHLARAQGFVHSLSDTSKAALTFYHLGRVVYRLEDYSHAETYWQKSLVLARENHLQALLVSILSDLSDLSIFKQKYEEAASYVEESVRIAREVEEPEKLVKALGNLGIAKHYLGQLDQAESLYNEALLIAEEHNYFEQIGGLYTNLGVLANARGNNEQAISLYQKALEIALQIGNLESINRLQVNLGERMLARGDYSQAEKYLNEGLEIARYLNNTRRICVLLKNLGLLALRRNEYTQAEKYLQKSLHLASEVLQHPSFIATIHLEWGALCLDLGDLDSAQLHLSKYLEVDLPGRDPAVKDYVLDSLKYINEQRSVQR